MEESTQASRLKALELELAKARSCQLRTAPAEEFFCLERAHILSQPHAGRHTYVHMKMLLFALRQRDLRELFGQTIRLLLAAPASLSGLYPGGNTGGSNVSALKTMPIPEDLKQFF